MNTLVAERWRSMCDLFDELVDASESVRSSRLSEIGAADAELRAALESLLAADATADTTLSRMQFGAAALLDRMATFAPRPVADPLGLAGRIITHFRVEEAIAAGGMGVVYRAQDTTLGRAVALKFPLPHLLLDQAAKERLVREAHAAGALDHPNICRVHEVGESDDGHVFLAMVLYPGETLKSLLARQRSLPIDRALEIGRQVAEGLACAHAAGVIHRDLKPGNLMVLPDGTVKILDFGLAKVTDITRTASHSLIGTAAYMAPEQIGGQTVDQRADLWALGVLLYEMLTGERPFGGDHELSIAHAILHDTPKYPSSLRAEVPRPIDEITVALLQKDVSDRYRSAREVAADIAAVQRGFTPPFRHRLLPRPVVWLRNRDRRARVLLSLVTISAVIAAAALGTQRLRVERPPTKNAQALEFYKRAQQYEARLGGERNTEAMVAAEGLYRRAISLDPEFALAHAGLASTLVFSYWWSDRNPARLEEIRREAQAALRLEPGLGEAYLALGDYWAARGNNERAWSELERARQAAPKHPVILTVLANSYLDRGRWAEGLAQLQRAQQLAAGHYGGYSGIATVYQMLGRYEAAARNLDYRITHEPDAYDAMLSKGYLFIRWQGIADTMAAALRRIPADWDPSGSATVARVTLALVQRRPGDGLAALDASRHTINKPTGWSYYPRPLLRAQLYALAGDSMRALVNYDSARGLLEDTIGTRFNAAPAGFEMEDFMRLHIALGSALAGLGRRAEAVRAAQRSVASVPAERGRLALTAMRGAAEIFAQAGEKAAAIELLERLLETKAGNLVSTPALRLEPRWDPLRNDPRFQQLLERYAN